MSKYYDEIMSLIGADEFKALIKKWDILSSNITRFPREQPILLPDLLCVGGSGVGKTKLIKLMSEYLYSKGNLVDFSGDGKFFEFLLTAHTQRLGGDLLNIALGGHDHADVVVLYEIVLFDAAHLADLHQLCLARHTVFLLDLLELVDDDPLHLELVCQDLLQAVNILLEGLDLLHAAINILAVEMAELDFCDVFCLFFGKMK